MKYSKHMLFGDDDAWLDKLLEDCFIDQGKQSYLKPILIGRWGIGKSALLINSAKEMSAKIKNMYDEDDRIWHIGERSIDRVELSNLRTTMTNNIQFEAALEKIWYGEIIRRECLLLDKLASYYEKDGNHWNYILRISNLEKLVTPLWNRIPDILTIIFKLPKTSDSATRETHGALNDLLDNKTLINIHKCHKDIDDEEIKPVIVIEPMDTPISSLEGRGLAQYVITSLLNVYYSHFREYQDPFYWIRLCVPWHRYKPDTLDFPQRFQPYTQFVKWDKNNLKEFINRRILWEFNKANRNIGDRVPWDELFDKYIHHRIYSDRINERSCCFIIRHTHYRPRELLRLARWSVEKQAQFEGCSVKEIISTGKVFQEIILSTINDYVYLHMQNDFMPEIKRRYGVEAINELSALVSGLTSPFSFDDLYRRYKSKQLGDGTYAKFNSLFDILWETGIMGAEISPKNNNLTQSYLNEMSHQLGLSAYKPSKTKSKIIWHNWYLFEYNYLYSPNQIIRTFEESNDTEYKLILHPSVNEYFGARVKSPHPLGV